MCSKLRPMSEPSVRLRPLMRVIAAVIGIAAVHAAQENPRFTLADRVTLLTRDASWTLVASIPIRFRTFHPQGMVKIGQAFFVSSVEVQDRAAGRGTGHLFQIDGS